jgi:hypothetical protein
MPRRLPRFDLRLLAEATMARDVISSAERARIHQRNDWPPTKIEYLYELAFLRLFSVWESTVESVFLRMMCGHSTRSGQRERLLTGRYCHTINDAEIAVLAGQQYALWHNSTKIVQRCQRHFSRRRSSAPPIIEGIISSHQARLDAWAAVRHRIVHEQNDARNRFNQASLMFVGRTYSASRPGKFLSDLDRAATPPRRWIDTAILEFTGLARQMV